MSDKNTMVYPKRIFFGLENGLRVAIAGNRVIELQPVIEDPHYRGIVAPAVSRLRHYRIVVSGAPPKRDVIDSTTDFSFVCGITPRDEEPYDVQWFFESVEWKDASGGWEWTGTIWDEFVADRMEGEWPKPREFLGIARYVDRPSRDEYARTFGPRDGRIIACYYRLPPPRRSPEVVYSV